MEWLRKLWASWATAVYFLVVRGSVLLVLIVGWYYTYTLFQNLSKDTTPITNAAFAIVASLSALSFSCARSLEGPPDIKDRYAYGGECFFHAGVNLLIASILKYALTSLQGTKVVSTNSFLLFLLNTTIGVIVGLLFFWALMASHTGLRVLNSLLWQRFRRHKDWDYTL